jgi:hypothetical protein
MERTTKLESGTKIYGNSSKPSAESVRKACCTFAVNGSSYRYMMTE